MLAIGPGARDIIRAALTTLAPYAAAGHYATIAEDVLLALPARCDDELLAAVAPFASSPARRIRELTLSAIARAVD